MKPSKIDRFLDFYVNNALLIDFILLILIWLLNSKVSIVDFKPNSKDDDIDVLSDIISASLSLAGFILAALTIIAAMRANIINKPAEAAKNPLELFFSNGSYKKIMKVFQGSIIELTFIFVAAFIVTFSKENITEEFLFKAIVSFLLLMSLSTVRSLLVLFTIIGIKDSD